MDVVDDNANYPERLQSLESGKVQLAAFPLDSLIKASLVANKYPATVVAILDESRGADAMIAYRDKFPNIDALRSNTDTKLVLVGDSPSETLARVVLNDFGMRDRAQSTIDQVPDSSALKTRYLAAAPAGNEVFVTWEPLVGEMLKNDQLHVLVDSSRFSGYVVDCLVVSRDFLVKNESVVRDILECYFKTLYEMRDPQALSSFLQADSRGIDGSSEGLSETQAAKLLSQIAWRNTQENYAHFGLRDSGGLDYIEDMIEKITRVLISTEALAQNPLDGQYNRLFFDRPLRSLRETDFHPGITEEQIRGSNPLPSLSEEQWAKLQPVGTLSVPPLVFGRGTSKLTEQSQQTLLELVDQLKSWPQYYLMIRGNASTKGNVEANRKLANERAATALEFLQRAGVDANRLRATSGELTGETSVQFVFGQTPY